MPHFSIVGEITAFLSGFILGQSRWSARLSHRNRLSDTIETLSVEPTCYLTSGGLVLHFKTDLPRGSAIFLDVNYFPNQGVSESSIATAQLSVRPHE